MAVARTSELSEKVPESSITLAEIISGGVKKNTYIYNIYNISMRVPKKLTFLERERKNLTIIEISEKLKKV